VSFTFDLRRPEDLPLLVDTLRQMALEGVIQSAFHLINEVVALSVLAQYPANLVDKCSRLPDATLRDLCARHGVATWSLGGGIQGTKGAVREARRQLKRRLGPLGRLMFVDDRLVGLVGVLNGWAGRARSGRSIAALISRIAGRSPEMLAAAPHVHSVLKGVPSDYFVRHAYFKSRSPKPDVADPDRDDVGLVWFAPIAPMTGSSVDEVLSLCRPLFERYAFDFYAALLMQNARSMIVLMSIFFRKDDPRQVENAQALYAELGRVTSAAGYQPYRVSVPGMERLTRMGPGFLSVGRSIKRALDAGGVIAPGKYGI
jgi:4-cresol dehydrogenase (hydroxylating)